MDIWEISVRLERGYDVCRCVRAIEFICFWLRKKQEC